MAKKRVSTLGPTATPSTTAMLAPEAADVIIAFMKYQRKAKTSRANGVEDLTFGLNIRLNPSVEHSSGITNCDLSVCHC